MEVDVRTEIEIGRPRQRVAEYAADPRNAPAWYVNIASAELRTPPPIGVGSQIAFSARFLGRRLDYVYEVIEHTLPQRMVMRTADGPFAMETTYTWEELDGGRTRMTLRNRGRPSGFVAVMALAMEAAMRRANRKDLARLRTILEAESG